MEERLDRKINMGFVLIENGEVYAPQYRGAQSVLIYDEKIVKIGVVNACDVEALGLPLQVVNAKGCLVVPGFIDPHEHIIGAGGEQGFASRMPEVQVGEIVCGGVTSVVGLLGTDTASRSIEALYSKVGQLQAEGINAYVYTGGFEIPAQSLTESIRNDLVFLDKVIGAGEIAISDHRWLDPKLHDLAVLVNEAMQGGMLGGKAGVTHFHVGEGKKKLSLLHELLDQYEQIPPHCIYPTHVTRTPELLEDAVKLAKRGAYVDTDTVDGKLPQHIRSYIEQGGPLERFTVSSDAHTPEGSLQTYFSSFQRCMTEGGLAFDIILPMFTSNVAAVLKLPMKGALEEQKASDVVVLQKESYDLVHVFALGRQMVRDGQQAQESQEEEEMRKLGEK